MSQNTKELIALLTRQQTACKQSCDQFAKDFKDNPSYACKWSKTAFKDAATLEVVTQVLKSLANNSPATLIPIVTDTILSRARFAPSSTSQVADFYERMLLEAYAEILENLKGV